jgi:SAM-dependent methyltransferase
MQYYYTGSNYDKIYKHVRFDIPFWINRAKEFGGPILELACGTGRVAVELAKENYEVVGLDMEESMLVTARMNARKENAVAEFIQSDMCNFKLNRKFSLIFIAISSISHLLDLGSLEKCLRCVRNHLKPEGKFILDVFNLDYDYLLKSEIERFPHAEYTDDSGDRVVITTTNTYDRKLQLLTSKYYYTFMDGKEMVEELNLRVYYPQEMKAVLKYNGFIIDRIYGNYSEEEMDSKSPYQIMVCSMK